MFFCTLHPGIKDFTLASVKAFSLLWNLFTYTFNKSATTCVMISFISMSPSLGWLLGGEDLYDPRRTSTSLAQCNGYQSRKVNDFGFLP